MGVFSAPLPSHRPRWEYKSYQGEITYENYGDGIKIDIQTNETEQSSETNLHICEQTISTRVTRPFDEEKIIFSTNGPGKLDIHMQKNEDDILNVMSKRKKEKRQVSCNCKTLRRKHRTFNLAVIS
jgi:hypothetical protein